MSAAVPKERVTQNRVVRLFRHELGYDHLGDWEERPGNSNIEEALLTRYLKQVGTAPELISPALHKLRAAAAVEKTPQASLYEPNKRVYALLRYGAQVKLSESQPTETVRFIDWAHPDANHFGIAEEVTLEGDHLRRPDLVLYVNGIALGLIELKRASVGIGDGIRQCLSNQQPQFHRWFFATVQLLFAGNDSEGLKYGTIETPEKFWLRWKEDEEDNDGYKLDKYLRKMCTKARFLELIHDFVLFDGGRKKVPRVHQYLGVKAAQAHVLRREGGIIWHTQGSGKSIVMVLLARWILERSPQARVAIITDRDELDKQIKGVFEDAGEPMYRTSSGRDLLTQLGRPSPQLLCSLVHKFGRRDVDDFDAFIADLAAHPLPTVGELFLFVDECHRTQSGKLHRTMKAMLPKATFIGFTGTPLLKADKSTSRQVFGRYIHTYNFGEAVQDKVVLDLVYEARDVPQRLESHEEVDQWFDAQTASLNEYQKATLRAHWATMQKVLSSKGRMDRIVTDIMLDFEFRRPRLTGERGTAMLVASSIHEACRYYDLFRQTSLKNRCAVVTSYNPQASDISKEDTGADTDTAKEFVYATYKKLLENVPAHSGMSPTEAYEDEAKRRFRDQPATMKLLIVVDKLLTGFDAPSCTVLYIDKSMQDHGLFQAICRTNRLDGDDKDYGYIVDYKDLFKRVKNALSVYTSELDGGDDDTPPEIELQDRLTAARVQLDGALEAMAVLCEPVEPPRELLQFLRFFCGNSELPAEREERRGLRDALYQATAQLARAYANLEYDMQSAGYSVEQGSEIRGRVKEYVQLRDAIRLAAEETLELKAYEADMRMLIDKFIEADKPTKISSFDELPLLELIIKLGIAAAVDEVQKKTGGDKKTAAETITHNVRSRIFKGQLTDPAYYARMSQILDELIDALRAQRLDYKEYLEKVAELAAKVKAGRDDRTPSTLDSPGKRALYHNIGDDEPRALLLHETVVQYRLDDWRGNQAKERALQGALYDVLGDVDETMRVFDIVKGQSEY